MRKFVLLLLVVFCLCAGANAVLAAISLGGWNEGAPGSTHERWDFTPTFILASGSGYTADPESVINPSPNRVAATITPIGGGGWDGISSITGNIGISVYLEIPNYEFLNDYKVVWVDIGNLVASGVTVSATDGGSTTFQYSILPGQGDAEFGVKIIPNPYVEKISFFVTSPTGGPAVMDYIHADTICIPEPITFVLLGLGAIALRRRK
jgi:hypothetical protein